ncbi:MAG: glycoside hydrolase family 97 protein [Planctomycetota bacterium]
MCAPLRLLVAVFVLELPASAAGASEHTLHSPDGKIAVTCRLDPSPPSLLYRVSLEGRPVVRESLLGLGLLEGSFPGTDLSLASMKERLIDESYMLACGKRRQVHYQANEMTLSLTDRAPAARKLDLVFRASNDGVAFRYVVTGWQEISQVAVTGERTSFAFPEGASGWLLDLGSFATHYETNYTKALLRDISAKALIGLPLLVKIDERTWVAVTEADLEGFGGLHLAPDEKSPGALVAKLAPLPGAAAPGGENVIARRPLPFTSPWRLLMIACTPGALIESDLVTSLAPPLAIEDTSWIKPGKATWPWWSGEHTEGTGIQGGMNTATLLHYLDFAAENGFEYLLIDAGWYGGHKDRSADITKTIPEVDLPRILALAKEKEVGVWLWLHWSCVADQMEKAFPLYEKWGIAGVKIDYMNRDDWEMVDFYYRVTRKAAVHHLMVDFHGAFKPDGIRRAYPNLITREGVLGLEWVKWSDRFHPEHAVTLPFTRMLAGPMDVTPGAFRCVPMEAFNPQDPPVAIGTRCHQLAMFVVFESPLQVLADYPASYRRGTGLDFLRAVPASWDETRVLGGAPGEWILLARRAGSEWYVGGMTGWEPRTLSIDLRFLDAGRYAATLYTDPAGEGADLSDAAMGQRVVTEQDVLEVALAPGGGCAIRLVPER